jgi:hypothetical protein
MGENPESSLQGMKEEYIMEKERLKCILSGLSRYELTGPEMQCVQSIERYFNQEGMVTDRHESILEGIYMEKTRFIRNAVFFNIQ